GLGARYRLVRWLPAGLATGLAAGLATRLAAGLPTRLATALPTSNVVHLRVRLVLPIAAELAGGLSA
ncbi:hypothetical protein TGVEG_441700, partial [Toxoplasma gondii VEG]